MQEGKNPLTTDQARSLAVDLVRQLSAAAGNTPAVNRILTIWLNTHHADRLGVIAMAALQSTYADHVTRTVGLTLNERTP